MDNYNRDGIVLYKGLEIFIWKVGSKYYTTVPGGYLYSKNLLFTYFTSERVDLMSEALQQAKDWIDQLWE